MKDKNGELLRKHHHVYLSKDFIQDCKVWLKFLYDADDTHLCRPFFDFSTLKSSKILNFYSDDAKHPKLGMGAVFNSRWFMQALDPKFIVEYDPSIEFLELFALTSALLCWRKDFELRDEKVMIYCDNKSVVHMVNNLTSNCAQCLKLIRILALESIIWNRKLSVLHVRSKDNYLMDTLFHLKMKKFWSIAPPHMKKTSDDVTKLSIWPMDRFWNLNDDYLPEFYCRT